ncbi:hypothetical protein ACFCWD_28900 [Streptomyces sp. NPDC056374]|uniref:hypothetical protein n=1 Tax=unclassified Streptomyces TaxID=2593676 RepID=UPI0035D85BBC
MTEQTARTPYAHKIRYGVTGAPHLPSTDLPEFGVIPSLVELIYSAARDDLPARVSASVTGYLTRDGKKVQPASQVAQHYVNGPDGWPEWLASEIRLHAAGIRDAARTAAASQTTGQTTHAVPFVGSGLTTCCRKPPFELPRTDLMSIQPENVTCHLTTGQDDTEPETAPCSGPVACEDEPCDRHEREQAHAEGEHALCGPECECTCAAAGPEFVPAGHYRDCPQYTEPEAPAHPAVNPACTNCNGGVAGQADTSAAVTLATPCDNCDHTLNWHSSQANCVVAFCGCGRFRPPAPAVGQPAEAHDTDEARPPRVQWVIELRDAEGWYPSGPEHQTLEAAQKRMATLNAKRPTWANGDPAERRVARKTTTWTVEDER